MRRFNMSKSSVEMDIGKNSHGLWQQSLLHGDKS